MLLAVDELCLAIDANALSLLLYEYVYAYYCTVLYYKLYTIVQTYVRTVENIFLITFLVGTHSPHRTAAHYSYFEGHIIVPVPTFEPAFYNHYIEYSTVNLLYCNMKQ